jgi:hypothetical protein
MRQVQSLLHRLFIGQEIITTLETQFTVDYYFLLLHSLPWQCLHLLHSHSEPSIVKMATDVNLKGTGMSNPAGD